MQNFNYHTHTKRCKHADMNMSDEDYVLSFIEKGFKKIAFTDHCPEEVVFDTRDKMRMSYDELPEYLDSIDHLKRKYKREILIESGFEVEYIPGLEPEILSLKRKVDKIILGQHFILDKNRKDLKIFRYQNFTDEDILKYAMYVKLAIKFGIPDIIAHPDIYMLSRNNFSTIEKSAAMVICKTARDYNIPLEINLSDASLLLQGKKDKIVYPCRDFWNVAKDFKGLKVLYGVDAHCKEQIELFEDSVKLVNKWIGEDIISSLYFCDENLK